MSIQRPRVRWRGGTNGLALGGVGLVVVMALVLRPGTSPSVGGPPAASGVVVTGTSFQPSPIPGATTTSPIRPVVLRTETIDALGPTSSISFPMGDVLSVSPDGQYAILWIQQNPANQVELQAVPFTGGEPIRLGMAGFERRGPEDAVFRLALPAWSADGRAVAFENGTRGTVVSLVGDAPIPFTARTDAPITPLNGGGFIVQTAAGPSVVAGAGSPAVSIPADLREPIFFGDGAALVGFTDSSEVVWTDGKTRTTVAASPGEGVPSWSLLARTASFLVLAPEGRRLDFGVLVVGSDGLASTVELQEWCSDPDISDDGRFVAYTVCDNSGMAQSYRIRLVRLEDGAAIDLGQGVGSPKFVPGSHRLAWLALSGNPPISPIYTLSVATNEVLP